MFKRFSFFIDTVFGSPLLALLLIFAFVAVFIL